MERVFDAPRELVWAAMTTAEHIHNWWRPYGTYANVREMDVRPGGRWWIGPGEGGVGVAFTGEFLEVVPPERLVRTGGPEVPAGAPNTPAVETITFEIWAAGPRWSTTSVSRRLRCWGRPSTMA
jgi:uncharacterized protein YndB with AHSA1/START domain